MSLVIEDDQVGKIGHWQVHADTGELFWSDEVYRIHGLEVGGEVDVEAAINTYHPDDRDKVAEYVRCALEEKEDYQFELRLVRPDGEVRHVKSTGVVRLKDNGDVKSVFGVFQDITDIKQVELALNMSNQRMSLAAESAGIGIWDWDLVKDELIWDDRMFTIYGVKPEEFGGAYEAWQQVVHPDDVERSITEVDQTISGEKGFDTEFRIIRPKGEVRHIKANGALVRDDDGTPLRLIGTNIDITERKRDEIESQLHRDSLKMTVDERTKELKESENGFKKFYQIVPDVFMVSGLNSGLCINVNDGFCRTTGYSIEDVIGKNVFDLHLWEKESDYEQLIAGLRQDKLVDNLSANFLRKDGTLWPGITSACMVHYKGEPHILSSTKDVSKIKEVEVSLIENQMRFHDFAQIASDWFWETDAEHRFKWFSVKSPTLDAMLGKTRWAVGDADNNMTDWQGLKTAFDSHSQFSNVEFCVRDANNSKFWTSINGRALIDENGQFTGFRGTARDITVQKLSQEERDQEIELRKNLQETTLEGYWNIDNEGLTADVNPAMCRILGRSKEEIIGKGIYEFVDAENAKIFKQEIAARKAGKTGAYEIALQRPDGTNIPCLNNATPFFDKNGIRVGSVGMWTDITERKEIETREHQARTMAETANRAKSELLANMSHELRTPLNAIIGFSEIMKSESLGPLNDKYKSYSNDIHNSGAHLLELINDILDVSAIEAGKIELHEETLKVANIIDSTLRMINERSTAGDINLSSDIDKDLPMLRADKRRLKQILLNLLSNAIKFTLPDGKITLTASLDDEGRHVFTVIDTGIGMSKGEVSMAMSEFGQVDSGLDRKHEGVGLGLPLTKGLVELHGGTLEIESKKGKGTAATVRFPLERRIDS